MKKVISLVLLTFSAFCITTTTVAQTATDTLRMELEALKEEIRILKLSSLIPQIEMQSFSGLGPAASKVYYSPKGLSIAGYGEVVYENYLHDTKSARGDVLRFVPYIGYKFSEKIVVNAELEIEHAGIKNVGNRAPEVYTEFLYLDFLINKHFNIRPGLILLPVSLTNEYHEPTVYFGTLRPDVERMIIPTVWREIGVMLHGQIAAGFSYKVAATNGMRTDLIGDWLGGGRQRGAEVNFDKMALSGRFNYSGVEGLNAGVATYYGQGSKGQGAAAKDPETIQEEATFALFIVDAAYDHRGWRVKGMFSMGTADGDSLYEVAGRAKEVEGYYGELGYNVLKLIKPGSTHSLSPFIRYEMYNLNKDVFTGLADKSKERTVMTVGLDYKPHPQVVLKADYQMRDTESAADEGKGAGLDEWKIDQFNMGIGFIF